MAKQLTRDVVLLAMCIGLAIGLTFAGLGLYALRATVGANATEISALSGSYANARQQLHSQAAELRQMRGDQRQTKKQLATEKAYSVELAGQVRSLGGVPVKEDEPQPTPQASSGSPRGQQPKHHPRRHKPAPATSPSPTPTPRPTAICLPFLPCT